VLLVQVVVDIGLQVAVAVEPINRDLRLQVVADLVVHMQEVEEVVLLLVLQQVHQVHNQLVEVVVEPLEFPHHF
jgi:hypothetical protein